MFVGWEDGKWGNSRWHWMKKMNWMASSTSDEPSRILTCDWNASYGFMKRTLTAADKELCAPDSVSKTVIKTEIYSNMCAVLSTAAHRKQAGVLWEIKTFYRK